MGHCAFQTPSLHLQLVTSQESVLTSMRGALYVKAWGGPATQTASLSPHRLKTTRYSTKAAQLSRYMCSERETLSYHTLETESFDYEAFHRGFPHMWGSVHHQRLLGSQRPLYHQVQRATSDVCTCGTMLALVLREISPVRRWRRFLSL